MSDRSTQPRGFIALLVGATWALLITSWATSAYGIYTIGVAETGVVLAVLLGAGVSGVIQVLLGGFWYNGLSRGLPYIARAILVALGVVFSLASGGLAAAFYTDTLQLADDYERVLNARRYASISAPAERYADDFERVASAFASVAAASADKKALESGRGGSCDTPKSRKGDGPIWRMRSRTADEAALHSSQARAQADKAREAARLPDVIDDASMYDAYRAVRSLSVNGEAAKLRDWAAGLANAFEGRFVDPESGRGFTCRDAHLTAKLRGALGALDAAVDLPPSPPTSVSVGIREAAGNSFGMIYAFFMRYLDPTVQIDEEALAATKPAFVIALSVETLIIVLILVQGLVRSGAGTAATGKLPGFLTRPLGLRLREAPEDVKASVDTLDAMSQHDADELLLFVPLDGDDTSDAMRSRLMSEVGRWRMKRLDIGGSIDLAGLLPERYALLSRHAPGARRFAVYVVPREAQRWMIQARLALQTHKAAA